MKTCIKCGKLFEGRRCLECSKAYSQEYYKNNKEKCVAATKKWESDNQDKIREYRRISSRNRYYNNQDKAKQYAREYHAKNVSKCRLLSVEWRSANKEHKRIYDHNRRVRKVENGGLLSVGLSNKLFKLQRGKCACCGQPLGVKYHLDHIMPLALGGPNTDDNIQLLRSTCNQQKHAKHPIDFMRQRGFLL